MLASGEYRLLELDQSDRAPGGPEGQCSSSREDPSSREHSAPGLAPVLLSSGTQLPDLAALFIQHDFSSVVNSHTQHVFHNYRKILPISSKRFLRTAMLGRYRRPAPLPEQPDESKYLYLRISFILGIPA